jgi:hypothetical protein
MFVRNRIVLSSIVSVLGVSLTVAAPARAALLTFDFSFTGSSGYVAGTVTGVISGVSDNSTGPAADVTLLSAPSALGNSSLLPIDLFQAGWTFNSDTFTVSSGTITEADFQAVSNIGAFSINHSVGISKADLLSLDGGNTEVRSNGALAAVTFTPVSIPEPASLSLAGITAAALLGRRRRM